MFNAADPQGCVADTAATMRVCRVCLAMSVKMHHMSEHNLTNMYKQVTGVEINKEDKLPQMLCWECVARLTSSNHFKEKALKTQWILLSKLIDDKCITLSDIESIDRGQYQLESTLGFKYYEANNSDVHIERQSGEVYNTNEEDNKDPHKIEEVSVNMNYERVTIKSEYLEETERQDEADFQMPTVIPKKEILSDEEMMVDDVNKVDEITIEVKLEDVYKPMKQTQKRKRSNATSLSNQRGEAFEESEHCKELRGDLGDIMDNSNQQNTHGYLKQFTAQSSEDSEIAHQQIKDEILDDSYDEKITIYVPGIATGSLDDGISFMQNDTKPSKNGFFCDICGNVYNIKSSLARHMKKHPKRNPTSDVKDVHAQSTVFTCDYCGYGSFLKYRLREHINTKHTKNISYNCSLCSYKGSYKCALAKHINAKHTKTDVYYCSLCDYSAYDKGTLSKHINAQHTKINVHNCSYCSFKTYQKGYLNVHVNAKHTKANAYNCSYCTFRTYKKFNLTAHVNAKHTKANVYNCSLCSYNAYDKSTLSKHVNAKHTRANVYNCTLCNYITYDKNSLSKHINAKHTKKNSYNCSHCNYKTYDRSALSKHNNSKHTKNVSYDCSQCNYKTYRRSTLSKHINAKHTKTISYDCSLCDYKAYQKSKLMSMSNTLTLSITESRDCHGCHY